MSNHHHHNCDHHHHDHKHSHQGHNHGPKNYNNAFFFGITLNFAFVLIEAFYGVFTNSLALVADAGHNLSDVAGLIIAWGAFWLASRKPTLHFTFGLRKSSILSALFNSIFLLIAVGIILWEAVHRILNPSVVESHTVMIVAAIGIVINTLTALLFFKNKDDDINIRGAYLHMAADAFISLGVVISAIVMKYTSWFWLDPLVSIGISIFIIFGTWDLLKDSIRLSLDAVPFDINPKLVKTYFENLDDVYEVHDLHIWAMSSTETALSVHLSVNSKHFENNIYTKISHDLKEKFKIHHPTIQIEFFDKNFECELRSEDVL